MPKFQLDILGCGSAKPNLQHLPSCQVINAREQLMMIDCGEGAQLQMMRQRVGFSRLRHIFISHLHGDHFLGLPGLISTLALQNITGSITIHTFADGARMLSDIIDYICRDRPFQLQFNIIKESGQVLYDDNALSITTIGLRHRVPAVGFIFREKNKIRHINPVACQAAGVPHYAMRALQQGHDYQAPDGTVIANHRLTTEPDPCRSYAYISDTRPSERVIEAINGIDWLYHEATYAQADRAKAHRHYHSTSAQAAEIARRANVKNLIIGHFSSRYANLAPLLTEARQIFPNTILANEGLTIDLNKDLPTLPST